MPELFIVSPRTLKTLAEMLGGLEPWARRCHEASLALVRAGKKAKLLPNNTRVARGWHPRVMSQHSWAVVGNPYDFEAFIIDPTLWSYENQPPGFETGRALDKPHRPHGAGNMFIEGGRPPEPVGEIIDLNVRWSDEAKFFFETIGHPLDRAGWSALAHSPMLGWPSGEIITAMYKDPRVSACIPIDVVGMVTNVNPGNRYW